LIDVIGLELEDARRRLEAAGAVVTVSETRSPVPTVRVSGPMRVVRQRVTAGGGVELLVTPERYDPASLRPGAARPSRE
jgi:hypothetical protein